MGIFHFIFSFVLLFALMWPPPGQSQVVPIGFQELVESAFLRPVIDSSSDGLIILEETLQNALASDKDLRSEGPIIAELVAKIYLQSGRYQEAIWALDRGGLYMASEFVAQKYEQFLKTEPIVAIKHLTGPAFSYAAQPRVALFRNGTKALLKPRDRDEPRSVDKELWAYEFDRMVGFNLVPAVVKRQFGRAEYSMHAFIENARDSGVEMRDSLDIRYPNLYLLDFITGNRDRHKYNSMFTPSNYLVAIDNGRIGEENFYKDFDVRMKPSIRLISRLFSLIDSETFKAHCAQYQWPKPKFQYALDFESISAKINELKVHFQIAADFRLDRPLTGEARLRSLQNQPFVSEQAKSLIQALEKIGQGAKKTPLHSKDRSFRVVIDQNLLILMEPDPKTEHFLRKIAELKMMLDISKGNLLVAEGYQKHAPRDLTRIEDVFQQLNLEIQSEFLVDLDSIREVVASFLKEHSKARAPIKSCNKAHSKL